MDSNFVIKVQYGDALRRFNTTINENGLLDLDINALRAKIFSLFSFPFYADVTLTYLDEDGDMVMLVDDNDLSDVMRQSLKFLRINIQLNNEKCAKSHARYSGNSTPKASPHVPNRSPNFNIDDPEWLKSVPKPVHEALVQLQDALSKLSLVSTLKPPTSIPVVAEPIANFFKPGSSFFNHAQQSQGGSVASSQPRAAEVPAAPPVVDGKNEGKKQETGHSSWIPPGAAASANSAGFGGSFTSPFSGIPMANYGVPPLALPPIGPVRSTSFQNDVVSGQIPMVHYGIRCDGCGANPIVGLRYKSRVKWDDDLCSSCFARMGNEADYSKIERPPIPMMNPLAFI